MSLPSALSWHTVELPAGGKATSHPSLSASLYRQRGRDPENTWRGLNGVDPAQGGKTSRASPCANWSSHEPETERQVGFLVHPGFDRNLLYAGMIERGLSTRTVEYTNAVLQSAFRQAIRWKMLAEDLVSGSICLGSSGRKCRRSASRSVGGSLMQHVNPPGLRSLRWPSRLECGRANTWR
jgi:hypothetical protein